MDGAMLVSSSTVMPSLSPNATDPYSNVTTVSILKACVLGVVAVLVLIGNTMCLIVLRNTENGVHPVTKLFLVSLTLSDLLVGLLVCVPVIGSTALQRWPYGETYCYVVAMCHALYFNAGLSVLAINIERYIAVVWPLRYPTIVTVHRAIVVEVFLLAMIVIWALLYLLVPGRSTFYYENFSACFIDADSGDDYLGQFGMTLFIAVPMLVTVILHARLFFLATRHASRVDAITIGDINPPATIDVESNSDPAESSPSRRNGPRRQRANSVRNNPDAKAAMTFFIMAVVAGVSWTPYYTTIAWENFRTEPVPPAVAFVSQILLLLNSLWNVLIYYTRNDTFRKTSNKLFGRCFRVRTSREELLAVS
ncbi:alpha-1A adrenergic receptor-like [Asterias rubens]|uniref:alpha-1A adrenergic receptor-like n=1 Tax=Asterias rubens TaxID=7604 RepID=UPI0014555687|nr:alpha-1A adrenergic receptor-like [Asterias rubens]